MLRQNHAVNSWANNTNNMGPGLWWCKWDELETNLKILTFACDEPCSDQLLNTTESSTVYDHWTVIVIKSFDTPQWSMMLTVKRRSKHSYWFIHPTLTMRECSSCSSMFNTNIMSSSFRYTAEYESQNINQVLQFWCVSYAIWDTIQVWRVRKWFKNKNLSFSVKILIRSW